MSTLYTKPRCRKVVRTGLVQLDDVSLRRIVRYKKDFLLDGGITEEGIYYGNMMKKGPFY